MIKSFPGSFVPMTLVMIEHPRKNCSLIGLLTNFVQRKPLLAVWKNCFSFFQYLEDSTSRFIIVYDAHVSKKAATLIGFEYLEGMTCMVMTNDGCGLFREVVL